MKGTFLASVTLLLTIAKIISITSAQYYSPVCTIGSYDLSPLTIPNILGSPFYNISINAGIVKLTHIILIFAEEFIQNIVNKMIMLLFVNFQVFIQLKENVVNRILKLLKVRFIIFINSLY